MKSKVKDTIGWREWAGLPDLNISQIKVKIDTGARTSSLHAVHLKKNKGDDGQTYVEFDCNPHQDGGSYVNCRLPMIDERKVKSSNGHESLRPVVETTIQIGKHSWPIEITLIDRDIMGFRMLLGRHAMKKRFLVDPGASFLLGK